VCNSGVKKAFLSELQYRLGFYKNIQLPSQVQSLVIGKVFFASVWFTSRKQSADLSLSVFYQSVSAVAALSYQSAGKPGRDGK